MAAPQASSRLEMLQARFQQRILAEKEQKLLQLYDQQQMRAHQVAQRGSAGSNGSNNSAHGNSNMSHNQTTVTKTSITHSTSNSQGGGKVRQMFDERRQTTVKGIDKSYPLEPLENRSRKHQTFATSSVNSTSQLKNGNPTSNRRSVVSRRSVRTEANGGLNNGKPIVTYHEEVTREIDDDGERRNERDEFYDDNYQHSRYEHDYQQIERPNNLNIQDVTNENDVTANYRSTAKINVTELDKSTAVTDRISESQANEQAESDEIIEEARDKLPRRSSAGRKTLQTETRFERPKNTIGTKIGQTIKQFSGNSNIGFPKKRNDIPQTGSRVTKVEEIGRDGSTSPEVLDEKWKSSSPEVSDAKEKMLTSCPVGDSPCKASTGYTRVSQLCHKNSTDFYPRRKSEFEKSKTFRKLQLELGESSPEPHEPDESSQTTYGNNVDNGSSDFRANLRSGRRTSLSPKPDNFGNRKIRVEASPERSNSRRGSSSPYRTTKESSFDCSSTSPSFGKHSIVKKDDPEKAGLGMIDRRVEKMSESSTANLSPRRSFSSDKEDLSKKEKIGKDKWPSESQEVNKIWMHKKNSILESEDKQLDCSRRTSYDWSTYSSRQHSSSPTELSKERKMSNDERSPESSREKKKTIDREKSPNTAEIKRSQSPTYRTAELIRKIDNQRASNKNTLSKKEKETEKVNKISIHQKESISESEDQKMDYSRKRTSYDWSTYSSRQHTSSPTELSKERKLSNDEHTPESNNEKKKIINREKSPDISERKRSQSPTYRTAEIIQKINNQRASNKNNVSKKEKINNEKYLTVTQERNKESTYQNKESISENEDKKSDYSRRRTSYDWSTYSSRQHSSSPTDLFKEQKLSNDDHGEKKKTIDREKSSETWERKRSQSPTYRTAEIIRKIDNQRASNKNTLSMKEKETEEVNKVSIHQKESISESEDKKSDYSRKRTSYDWSTYSSRQHSSSPTELSKERKMSNDEHSSELSGERKKSLDREKSPNISERKRSQSPIYRSVEPIRKINNQRASNEENSFPSSTTYYSSKERHFSTYPNKSPKNPEVSQRSSSPVADEESRDWWVKKTETKKIRSDAGIVTTALESSYTSTKRSTYSPAMELDVEYSSEIRSREKQYPEQCPESAGSPRRGSIKKSEDGKWRDDAHYAAPTYSSRRRSSGASGRRLDHEESQYEVNDKRQDNETSRNKSVEQLRSFELVKNLVRASTPEKGANASEKNFVADPRDSPEITKSSEKNIIHKVNKKEKKIERKNEDNDRMKNDERTKSKKIKSGSKVSEPTKTAMRDTASFKAKKSRMSVEKDDKKVDSKSVKEDSQHKSIQEKSCNVSSPEKISSTEKSIEEKNLSEQGIERSELRERIERIRSTLSRSDRSEQNNFRSSNEFERTDSVESALKRFDSIGVETEHCVTVGIDETDRQSPEFFTTIENNRIPANEPIAVKKIISHLGEDEKEAGIEKESQKIDTKARSSKERVSSRVKQEKSDQTAQPSNKEKLVSVTRTPSRNSEKANKSRPKDQKKVTSRVKKSQFRSKEASRRGEANGESEPSPLCKRKLFQDSESEVENEDLTVTSSESREIEMRNNRENTRRKETESVACNLESGKMLRSIGDIRKSMKSESHVFHGESKKFETGVEQLEKKDIPKSFVTGTSVKIVKTVRMTGEKPVVRVERTVVKLPITRHRVAKSPSPDIGTKRPIEGKTRTATSSVRKSVPSSPIKTPDATATTRYGTGTKSQRKIPPSSGSREIRSQKEYTITTEYSDVADGPEAEVTVTEISTTQKNNDACIIDFNDSLSFQRKETASREEITARPPSERSAKVRLEGSRTSTPVSRATSALSTTSSGTSGRGQSPQTNAKSKMSTKAKSPSSNGPRGSSVPKVPPPASEKEGMWHFPPANQGEKSNFPSSDGLVACKICGRRFNSDRVAHHEQICTKTTTKKRKQFDTTVHRVKGTELESFVKKAGSKKPDRKPQKPEIKSNWRRKHEDFINAIRSAKQVSAHLAAGGKLSDLPPPPPSDTSDYIQCPHCGRKFNQAAAERHIPKCETMMHNKPNPRAPPKPKR